MGVAKSRAYVYITKNLFDSKLYQQFIFKFNYFIDVRAVLYD